MIFRFAESVFDEALKAEADHWQSDQTMERIWNRDATVFGPPGTPEISNRLGWLDLPVEALSYLPALTELQAQAKGARVTTVVLCGMGGSSLAPEVFAKALRADEDPNLIVADTTHPDALTRIAHDIDVETTWFVISSKSGTTIETASTMEFFWQMASDGLGDPGSHFIAVTDPQSELAMTAADRGFRSVFEANPNVGGRYSAISHFGLVPASLIGIDPARLISHAAAAAAMCRADTPLGANPAFTIGAAMALAAQRGIDKARFVETDPETGFGAWAEQLLAESTGKNGRGIVPIDGGPDRPDATDELTIGIGMSPPFESDVTIEMADPYDIAGLMFVLELATAVAGRILGIHPFNQPDVQRAKQLAAAAMSGDLESGSAPLPINDTSVGDMIRRAIDRADNSYIGIHAYIAPSGAADAALDRLRTVLASRTGTAVTVGYGPRFLHSTGQLHKGGPKPAAFLQLVDTPTSHVEIPNSDTSFDALISGQAIGDRQALADAAQTVIAIDLGDQAVPGIVGLANLLNL